MQKRDDRQSGSTSRERFFNTVRTNKTKALGIVLVFVIFFVLIANL